MVKTEIRKGKEHRKQQICARERQAKNGLRDGRQDTALKGRRKPRQKIVAGSAEETEESAEQKSVKMAHFKSPDSSFPPP